MLRTDPEIITLASGLRLVHLLRRGAGAGIFGMAVRAGSSDEVPGQFGLAHLVEHTIFKGTARRSSWHIINRMEAVGGELNAYTTKEETVVYSVFPAGRAARAVELIADLALNSRFPSRELEKEREVVLDEINSYYDQPAEALYDDFEDKVFAGSPLGHNILGSPTSVRALGSDDCRAFLDRYYTADNIVLFYSGSRSAEYIARMAERYFADMAGREKAPARTCGPAVTAEHFENYESKAVHQAHVMMGVPVDSLYSDSRYAIALLSNLAGGPGMNSLLNVELRERRGLVYTVEATTAMFSCGGLLNVYFGCDAEDMEQCIDLSKRVFGRIAESGLSPRRLEAAKKQYLGQLAIAAENAENRIMAAARSTLFRGAPTPTALSVERINSVTSADLSQLAARISTPSVLAFVP